MKKFLLIALSLVLVFGLAFGLAGCKKKRDKSVSYSLDTTEFRDTVEYKGQMDLTGLVIVSSKGDRVQVTPDMIGGVDTNSIGDKTFTVSYNGQTFNVGYSVKFLVTFIVNGVETKHYVTSAAGLTYPEIPEIVGKQFEGWSKEIPATLSNNIVIEAMYKSLSNAREDVYTWLGEGIIDITGYAPAGSRYEVTVLDENESENSSLANVSLDETAQKISYKLNGNAPVIIALKAYNGEDLIVDKSWHIERAEKPEMTLGDGSGYVGAPVGDRTTSCNINYDSVIPFRYQITPANGNVEVGEAADMLFIKALKAGVTQLNIKAINATNPMEAIELTTYVVITPSAFHITETQKEFGIEGIWTVGSDSFGGTLPKLNCSYSSAHTGEGFTENITWVTDSEDITVENGVIKFRDNLDPCVEYIHVFARFSYGNVSYDTPAMTVRCVIGGVNVFNYTGLYQESIKSNPRPIVLQNNIIDDFSSTNFVWMNTTYDSQYYDNRGETARVKVLMQFKNDVYGNGYEINAHNATLGTLDTSGSHTAATLFKGPLNFVAFSQNASDGAISVKAQDNICFAVYEGVTLNNITLRSCKLEPDPTTGKLDLTDLNDAGTTVEVLGDGVTIEYSRINNGRTVLRVFGDVNDPTKEIHLTIKKSILSYAREFIIRMGSNCFVESEAPLQTTESPYSPLLLGDSGSEYETMKKGLYSKMSAEEKAAYDEKFIKTYVTVEDCVFEEAGIFAIGLDSHFAGMLLYDATKDFPSIAGFESWKRLAKTSYGAKLIFKGDVRMYNWKKLDDIDSSTLISNNIQNLTGFGSNTYRLTNLQFDVKAMVKDIANPEPGETNYNEDFKYVIDVINGVEYVHNGIAFFGGGKNYSVFENQVESVSFNHKFEIYKVTFADVEQDFLRHAAGNEPFFFVIYDALGSFKYNDQQNLKNKYEVVYKK